MFTGIVQGRCRVRLRRRAPNLLQIAVVMPEEMREGLVSGASVAINGVCLTVTGQEPEGVHFDLMADTLAQTTLGALRDGDEVNVERSARQGDEIGGHWVSGHVDGRARIVAQQREENLFRVRYRPPAELMKYLLRKGFVAINGCSLTIAGVDRAAGWFEVGYIPETLRVTTHGALEVEDEVNLEVDRQTQAIVATVERLLRDDPQWLAALAGDRPPA